jgi:beta-N-acetylhexosaminidase
VVIKYRILFFTFFSVLFFNFSVGAGEFSTQIKKMPLSDKIGQLFIVGVSGKRVSPDMANHLKDLSPGGVILFRRNIQSKSQLLSLTKALQRATPSYKFIAVDQEGGSVVRLPTRPKMPSAAVVGALNDVALTEELGLRIGRVLRTYGINMNLAPVLDVASAHGGFLKSRAYSSDPKVVGENGTAFARGLISAGILPTAKHFPGLGSVSKDPHTEAVSIESSAENLESTDIEPFKQFASLAPAAVMLSHAEYPSLDSQRNPATFSRKITTEILRESVGFKGLVITDDLLMSGAGQKMPLKKRLITALSSGTDMLLFAWSPKSQLRAKKLIEAAVKENLIAVSLIDEKVEKIFEAKAYLKKQADTRLPASDAEKDFQIFMSKFNLSLRH